MSERQMLIGFVLATAWIIVAGPPTVWFVRGLDVSYPVGVYMVGYILIAPMLLLLGLIAWQGWKQP